MQAIDLDIHLVPIGDPQNGDIFFQKVESADICGGSLERTRHTIANAVLVDLLTSIAITKLKKV